MKKIIYLIFPIILIFLISECSDYKPIFSSSNIQFVIADSRIEGDKRLGTVIFSKLKRISDVNKNNEKAAKILLSIDVSKTKTATAKDSSGKILDYYIVLNTVINIKNYMTNETIINQEFIRSTSYKVQDRYSDTVNVENNSIENLLDNTFQDLLIILSQNIL